MSYKNNNIVKKIYLDYNKNKRRDETNNIIKYLMRKKNYKDIFLLAYYEQTEFIIDYNCIITNKTNDIKLLVLILYLIKIDKIIFYNFCNVTQKYLNELLLLNNTIMEIIKKNPDLYYKLLIENNINFLINNLYNINNENIDYIIKKLKYDTKFIFFKKICEKYINIQDYNSLYINRYVKILKSYK